MSNVQARQAAAEFTIAPQTPASAALSALVDAYGAPMYQLAVRLCGNPHDAQDLVQEVFLRAFRAWSQFEGRSSVKTWLFTIAARTCGRLKRPRAGQPAKLESLDELLPFGEPRVAMLRDHAPDPSRMAARRDLHRRAEAAIAHLPVEFRVPLILRDVLDLSIEDIASALGIQPQTVKTRVHRARLRVRNAIADGLPARAAPPVAYSKRVCLDLLQAKQQALDRNAPFPLGDGVVCERCRAVFASLDLGRDICRRLGRGPLPAKLRRDLLAHVGA